MCFKANATDILPGRRMLLSVADEGVSLTNQASSMNFVGGGIVCTVDASGSTVTCTVSAVASGGGGGGGNFRFFLDGLDTGVNAATASFTSGNGASMKVYTSSFEYTSLAATASVVISTIQAFRILSGTATSSFILHVATANGYSGPVMALSTGSNYLWDLRTSSWEIRIATIIIYGGQNTFLTVQSTHAYPFAMTIGNGPDNPGIWTNGTGFAPMLYVTKQNHAIIDLRDSGAGQSEMFMQCDAGGTQFGSFTNSLLTIYTNNLARANFPAAGGFIVKSTDLFVGPGGLVSIGTTSPKAMIHLALINGATTDMRFVRFSTGDTIIMEVTASSFNWIAGLSSTFSVLAGSFSVPNASFQDTILVNSPAGAGSCTNCNLSFNAQGILTLAGNGSATGGEPGFILFTATGEPKIDSLTLFKTTGEPIIQSWVLSQTTVAESNRGWNLFRTTGPAAIDLLTIRLNNVDSSTAAIQAQIQLLSTSSLSGGGGGVKSLYLRSTFDTSNTSSYFLMQTTPAATAEVTKTAAVASANGLVMLSSHSTLMGGMGQSVVTLPTGFWQFVLYAGIDSIVNQTDLICNLSTMSKTGTNKFQFLAATITNVNTLTPSQFVAETVLTSDVVISTDDRVVLDIYARTSSALTRTVTLAIEGVARVSRIGTTVERQPTFLALNDTPASYNGKSGQFPQVNPGETALIFNSIDTTTAITAISTTGVFAQTTYVAVQSTYLAAAATGAALTNFIAAVSVSSNAAAASISTNSVAFSTITWDFQIPRYSSAPLVVGVSTGGYSNGLPQFQNAQSSAVNVAQYDVYLPTGIALVGDPSLELVGLSTGADAGTLDFVVSIATLGSGAVLPVSTASLTNPILVQTWGVGFSTPSTRVSNRVVATGWKTALQSAGGMVVFQVARNGNSGQDGSTQDNTPLHLIIILPRQNAKQYQ